MTCRLFPHPTRSSPRHSTSAVLSASLRRASGSLDSRLHTHKMLKVLVAYRIFFTIISHEGAAGGATDSNGSTSKPVSTSLRARRVTSEIPFSLLHAQLLQLNPGILLCTYQQTTCTCSCLFLRRRRQSGATQSRIDGVCGLFRSWQQKIYSTSTVSKLMHPYGRCCYV